MKPYIIAKEMDEAGEVVYAGHPEKIRRVISEETAKTLKDFFIGVVERGTGQSAKIPGITIAGRPGRRVIMWTESMHREITTQPSSDFFQPKSRSLCV